MVLEVVPTELAGLITRQLKIPTIRIGAGPDYDGQVQVCHDLLGAFTDLVPQHVKRYVTLADTTQVAFTQYLEDVRQPCFPRRHIPFSCMNRSSIVWKPHSKPTFARAFNQGEELEQLVIEFQL